MKTTGGKGLHVVVPIARRYDWEQVKSASQKIAELLSAAAPDRYVTAVLGSAPARPEATP